DAALAINTIRNKVRRMLGLRYWSVSAWAKFRVKKAVNFIGSSHTFVSDEARRSGADGVTCGHFHHAHIEEIDGIEYS
ncbi:hypothetical protein KC221_30905, partial [Mycobacterium tuberculosis]|nr:hypothetical protein [Mycobacterium tuberculosis]